MLYTVHCHLDQVLKYRHPKEILQYYNSYSYLACSLYHRLCVRQFTCVCRMSETIDTSGVASKTEDNPQCQSSEPPQNFSDWTFGTRCLTLREQAIIQTIQNFTEEADWHIRVWDNAVVAEWYQRAASNPLITPKTWLWCIKELRDKAQVFEQDGYVWAIDSSSRVCKSDTCISSSVKNCLRDAISTLEKQHAVSPISGNMADIVDPAMYPLIRGQTRVARDTAISLNNVLESFGIGTPEPYEPADLPRHLLGEDEESNSWVGGMHQIEGGSSRLQWLPFEIEFTQKTGTDVKIVSYINNVHPDRDQGLYSAIEKLIPSVISSWNQVLVKDCRSRTPNRIGIMKLERDYEPILQTEDQDSVEIIDVNPPRPTAPVPELIVEPGEAFTFDEWKVGRKTAPMQNAGPVTRTLLSAELYPSLDHQFYSVEIENEFRDTGLQIILKLGGTGVLSSQPWSGGVTWEEDIWHFSGLPNERIVGTAMYFYDVQNIANPGIKFRQLSQMDKEMWYESALSASLKTLYQPDFAIGFIHPYLQDMGCVSIRENRLLTWPNTMEYKFNPFQLEDTTVPGRCSFATLYLVDPYNRICSTKHVPPQQHDWWMEQVLEAADFESKGLPQEIVDYIARYTDHWPIGIDEAKRLKDRMDDEHTDWHLSMSGRREGDMDA